ncbi:hypothetical protein D3C77_255740 [compost metagenome]
MHARHRPRIGADGHNRAGLAQCHALHDRAGHMKHPICIYRKYSCPILVAKLFNACDSQYSGHINEDFNRAKHLLYPPHHSLNCPAVCNIDCERRSLAAPGKQLVGQASDSFPVQIYGGYDSSGFCQRSDYSFADPLGSSGHQCNLAFDPCVFHSAIPPFFSIQTKLSAERRESERLLLRRTCLLRFLLSHRRPLQFSVFNSLPPHLLPAAILMNEKQTEGLG